MANPANAYVVKSMFIKANNLVGYKKPNDALKCTLPFINTNTYIIIVLCLFLYVNVAYAVTIG